MKITIDSEIVNLPISENANFQEYCNVIMGWLLVKNKSIGSCKIDGQTVSDLSEANKILPTASSMEVESVPLVVALQSAVAIHAAQIRRLEDKCETLVTDCLLADPVDIARQWEEICEILKDYLSFIPRLGYLLTQEQIDCLINTHCAEIKNIMQDIAEALPKADVVVFSDILEMRLIPWLRNMREFSQTIVKLIEKLNTTHQ